MCEVHSGQSLSLKRAVLAPLALLLAWPALAEPCEVLLVVAGQSRPALADTMERVGHVLERAGITLGPNDRVRPRLWGEVFNGMEIHVVRVRVAERYEEQPLPYDIRLQSDPSLDAGKVRLASGDYGPGYRKGTFRIYERSDGITERVPLGDSVIVPGRPKVFLIGTRGGSGLPASLSGERVMHATAYSGEDPALSNRTAIGLPTGRGIIAVDPSVIPYGTKMWVEGYGLGVAGDCGGAIKGDRIDLCYDSYAEALKYGHKQVHVRFIP
jgi:3D (Asp-Asp-Asp) domain-containing protein